MAGGCSLGCPWPMPGCPVRSWGCTGTLGSLMLYERTQQLGVGTRVAAVGEHKEAQESAAFIRLIETGPGWPIGCGATDITASFGTPHWSC